MAKVKSTTEIEVDDQNGKVRKIVIHNDNMLAYWRKRCRDYLKVKRFVWHVELPVEGEVTPRVSKAAKKAVQLCERQLNYYMHRLSTDLEECVKLDGEGDKRAKKQADKYVKEADKIMKKFPRDFAKLVRTELNQASRGKVGRSISASGFFGLKLVEDVFTAADQEKEKKDKDGKGKDDKKKDDKKTK